MFNGFAGDFLKNYTYMEVLVQFLELIYGFQLPGE